MLAVDHDGDVSRDAIALVALEVEGADLAQALPGERERESGNALAIGALCPRALVGLRPGEEFLDRLVECEIGALRPADAGLALEDRRALHARQLASHRARDALPEAGDVALGPGA